MNITFVFILIGMIWLHIIDDYVLQNSLARFKQKDWWRDQSSYNDMYKNDYKIALLCHAFEWTGTVMSLPIIYTYLHRHELNYNIIGFSLVVLFVLNVIIHYIVDDLKANKKTINLVLDQLCHLAQIVGTFLWFISIII